MSCQCLVNMGILTYYQLNKDYIAEVLCINRKTPELSCNGKCFLAEKLKQTKQAREKESSATQQQKIEIPSFLVTNYHFEFQIPLLSKFRHPLLRDILLLPLLSFTVFQPPRG